MGRFEQTMAPEDRFWAKVTATGTCWVWEAGKNDQSYGQFWIGGRLEYAHRVAYELLVGPIPEGLHVDHLCRIRHCVNPDHLEPVSPIENHRRGHNLMAINARKTHCPRGHEYTPENTYIRQRRATGGTSRSCVTCQQAANRANPGHGRRAS